MAVSGGPDSVALLSILHQLAPAWNFSLTVVHCNYGLRGAESDGDASFVAALCRRLELPCHIRRLTVDRSGTGESSSLQARARESRYRLFRDVVAELGADRVALGHTADDQAETVLLRMLRGAGLRGLAGMPHIRESLFVRPLLSRSRQEILVYLQAVGLSYRTDSSNAKSIYLRNRVRHELLPVMQSLAPALQRRILRQAIQAVAPSTGAPRSDVLLSMLASLASHSGGIWNAGAATVACELDQVRLTAVSPVPPAGGTVLQPIHTAPVPDVVTIAALPSAVSWPLTGAVIRLRAVTRERGLVLLEKPSSSVALLDADRLSWPLTIRPWCHGDWFFPTGMAGRRKKLQDYFTDAKLGRSMRERIPLVLSGEGIAWIVGQRVDARFAATGSTIRFVLARVTQPLRRKGVF